MINISLCDSRHITSKAQVIAYNNYVRCPLQRISLITILYITKLYTYKTIQNVL